MQNGISVFASRAIDYRFESCRAKPKIIYLVFADGNFHHSTHHQGVRANTDLLVVIVISLNVVCSRHNITAKFFIWR